jgi:hypothetical protein
MGGLDIYIAKPKESEDLRSSLYEIEHPGFL